MIEAEGRGVIVYSSLAFFRQLLSLFGFRF